MLLSTLEREGALEHREAALPETHVDKSLRDLILVSKLVSIFPGNGPAHLQYCAQRDLLVSSAARGVFMRPTFGRARLGLYHVHIFRPVDIVHLGINLGEVMLVMESFNFRRAPIEITAPLCNSLSPKELADLRLEYIQIPPPLENGFERPWMSIHRRWAHWHYNIHANVEPDRWSISDTVAYAMYTE